MIYVEQSIGAAIAMFKQGTQKERPLTHDLLANILRALGAKIERVIVNDLKGGTYFARLVLSAENESQQKKIIEIDARPSDCIAMAKGWAETVQPRLIGDSFCGYPVRNP